MSENKINENNNLRSRVLSSVAWVGALKFSGQILTWIITIVVIRKLDPSDFGLFAEASIFIGFLMLLSELGFGSYIVQRKKVDSNTLSQVFGFVIITNITLSLILFNSAPFIARYFSEPRLVDIFRLLSAVFIFLGLYSVPQALLRRNMDFKSKSFVDLIAALGQSVITLILAFSGFGVWSLVWGTISMHIILLIGYQIACKVFILPTFKFKDMQNILSFGGYVTGGNLVWYYYMKADVLIGGFFLDSKLIGQFSVAKSLSAVPMEKIFPIVTQVALPAYSRLQSDLDSTRYYFLKTLRLASLLTFPLYCGLLIIAPELVELILGSRWSHIVPQIQILCLIMPFRALGSLLAPALIGIGKPKISLVNVSITASILTIMFIFCTQYGAIGICWAWVMGYGISFFLILKITSTSLGIAYFKVLSEIKAPIFYSLIMLVFLYFFRKLNICSIDSMTLILLNTLIGFIVYALVVYLSNKDLYIEIKSLFYKRKNN